MNYRKLGNSGLRLSEISLGSWLTYGDTVSFETSKKCISKAIELGINFFDTADGYGGGQVEAMLGRIFKEFKRTDLVISTKCYFPISDSPNDRGLSRKHIFESVHKSLKNLQVEYLDLMHFHRYDAETPLEETLSVINDLISQGKVLYWGVSRWSAAQIVEAVLLADKYGWHKPVSNQPLYNLFNRGIEIDVLKVCQRFGLGNLVYSPLAHGTLTGKYSNGNIPTGSRADNPETLKAMYYFKPEALSKVEKLDFVARQLELKMSQLALAWCLRLPIITSTIVGATKPEQIEENVKASGVKLADEALNQVEEIIQNYPVDQYTGLKL